MVTTVAFSYPHQHVDHAAAHLVIISKAQLPCIDIPLGYSLCRRCGLSLDEFRQQYEMPNRPVVITDAVTSWPACKKWTHEYMRKAFAGGKVIVGGLIIHQHYATSCMKDVLAFASRT